MEGMNRDIIIFDQVFLYFFFSMSKIEWLSDALIFNKLDLSLFKFTSEFLVKHIFIARMKLSVQFQNLTLSYIRTLNFISEYQHSLSEI